MSKRFYSYEEDTKAVAFIDIIGFSNLTQMITKEPLGPAGLALSFFENCILRYRTSMQRAFTREVPTPITGPEYEYKAGLVWHREVPEGAVNFAYMSDCAILYSNSLTHLFQELSSIFGAAVTFSVPLRGTICIGA